MAIFAPRDLACREVVELISDHIEGALPRRERRRLEAHLAACANCSAYLAQVRTTIRLSGRLRREDLSPQMRGELLELYRGWLAG
jgi:anti-sigma factor RsiW